MTKRGHKVFVYCDNTKHSGRRVAVTNYIATATGWHEQPASRAVPRAGMGMHMIGDDVAQDGWALDPEVSNADIRTRFELQCRKCGDEGRLAARLETLHAVLDGIRDAGVSEVPLRFLAASIQRKSEST